MTPDELALRAQIRAQRAAMKKAQEAFKNPDTAERLAADKSMATLEAQVDEVAARQGPLFDALITGLMTLARGTLRLPPNPVVIERWHGRVELREARGRLCSVLHRYGSLRSGYETEGM